MLMKVPDCITWTWTLCRFFKGHLYYIYQILISKYKHTLSICLGLFLYMYTGNPSEKALQWRQWKMRDFKQSGAPYIVSQYFYFYLFLFVFVGSQVCNQEPSPGHFHAKTSVSLVSLAYPWFHLLFEFTFSLNAENGQLIIIVL